METKLLRQLVWAGIIVTFLLGAGFLVSIQEPNVGNVVNESASDIAKIKTSFIEDRSNHKIQVTEINEISDNIFEVYARVWANKDIDVYDHIVNGDEIEEVYSHTIQRGNQVGFGKDGTVDIERFVFVNAELYAEDLNGDIVDELRNERGEVVSVKKYKHDPKEAILQMLESTLQSKQQKHNDSKIVANKVGNTTYTIYPDEDPETSSVDGRVEETTAGSWATIRADVGGASNAGASIGTLARVRSNSTTDQFDRLTRGYVLFDLSVVPGSEDIDSATFSLYGASALNGLGDPEMVLVQGSPASDTDLANSDYALANFGSTEFASRLTYAGFNSSGYNDMTINASGITYLNGTSVARFGVMLGRDFDNSSPTWSSLSESRFVFYQAEQTATTNDPKLVLETSESAGGGTVVTPPVILF